MASTYTTYATARDAYLANAVYEEERSVAKARTFISACRSLILLGPAATGAGESTVSFDPARFEKELQRAQTYVQRYSTDATDQGGVRSTRADFTYLRG